LPQKGKKFFAFSKQGTGHRPVPAGDGTVVFNRFAQLFAVKSIKITDFTVQAKR
jgi:hypothetical protein